MALVDYPSSDEEAEETKAPSPNSAANLKRKRGPSEELPPLPSKFHDLYASTTRLSTRDDPSLHGGRKRVIPHIEGNWPTHLYIEWYPSTAESCLLTALITKLQDRARLSSGIKIHSSLASELDVSLPLHISLSRSLGFSAEQKGEFVDSLERAVDASGIRPFDVHFTSLDWVANYEKTRWFLVLRIQQPSGDGLNKLLNLCNRIAKDRGQPPLYQSPRDSKVKAPKSPKDSKYNIAGSSIPDSLPSDATNAFHFSIAWTLEKPDLELIDYTDALQKSECDDVKKVTVKVEEIKAKVGNIVSIMRLPSGLTTRKCLFGI